MTDKGYCEHGEFILREGCASCIAERLKAREKVRVQIKVTTPEEPTEEEVAEIVGEVTNLVNVLEEIGQESKPTIVKVRYHSETTGESSAREYTYYSADHLEVGDVVMVPVKDTTGKAIVSAVDVPEAEIEAYKDKVKTIPSGAVVKVEVDRSTDELEEGLNSEGLTLFAEEKDATDYGRMADESTYLNEPDTALTLRPGEDIEAAGYHQQALRALEFAKDRVIATAEDNRAATEDLSLIAKLKKVMEDKRKDLLEPLKVQTDAIKVQTDAIRDTYTFLMGPILEADKITRDKMIAYDAEQKRRRQEQEAINRKRMEAAEAEARLNNGEISESVNLVEVAPLAPKSTMTDLGTAIMVDHWKYRIIDIKLIPREYMMPNAVLLGETARKQHDTNPVPGIEFYNEPGISMRTK